MNHPGTSRPAILAILTGLASLTLATGHALAAGTQYPLTIQNCGETLTFDKAPERVVSIGQSSTEILYSLGLSDKVVGTAVWFGPVLPGYEAANAKIKRLADNDPSFESVLAQEPDLVTAEYEWHVGPKGSVATRQQFHDLDIPSYVSPADCVAKDNSGGGDGVRKEIFNMSLIYQEIGDMARIFDVVERGDALIAELRKREAVAIAAVADSKANGLSMMFWFSSPEIKGDAYIAGKNGTPAYIMQALGAGNVIATQEEWPLVSWETIAGADPQVIVLARMDRRRFPADDIQAKLDFLATDPVASKLDAVRKNHIVIIDSQSMNPSLRTIDGIEAVSAGIKKFGLTH
ncbi:ABC transporter substrate-binding protein [Dongia sp.]|uniref:ABC transporter substrate-binding protein n=1 Tax=Dongia sp. TaxID=1977262 RepID=UPI0035AF0BA2